MKGKVFVINNNQRIRFYPSKGYRIISARCSNIQEIPVIPKVLNIAYPERGARISCFSFCFLWRGERRCIPWPQRLSRR